MKTLEENTLNFDWDNVKNANDGKVREISYEEYPEFGIYEGEFLGV